MRKKDKLKLDVVSNIDEKIIDEATDMKISLSQRINAAAKKARKRLFAIGGTAASFILIVSVFLAILIPLMGSDIPVYQGMTVRKEATASSNVKEYGYSNIDFTFLSASNDIKPDSTKDGHDGHDDKLEKDIQDMVSIDIVTDDEVKYYVTPNETFIIEIHISNPGNYEIQSFTLNGKKYANYMFKEGSTMEVLLLEVTAPETAGYASYTIDAIKYIDGTEIKDVDMSGGNKSIQVGIAYPTEPSATVTSQSISTTSIDLSIYVSDPYSLIGDNELSVYLSDGEKIVDSKPLTVGDNRVTFDGLIMSKTYEYSVVTAFDRVDGQDLHEAWLLTNTITTAGAFGISNAVPTQDAISFEVNKTGEIGTITSISLYDAETNQPVRIGGADTREFTNLLSNHAYNLYVDFTYTADGEEISDWVVITGITTVAKAAPVLTFGDMSVTDTGIVGKFNMEDIDSVGTITAVGIYQNGTLLQNNASKQVNFSGLDSYTGYRVVVTCSFDLNDGKGVQTATATYDFTTNPSLNFHNCTVMNTSAVSEGETIYLQINISNPNHAVYQKVVVNSKEYDVVENSSTATMLYCEIVNSGQFEGGNTTLTVEKVIATLGGMTYTIAPKSNHTASVFINGKLEITDFFQVVLKNGKFVKADYAFPRDETYLMVTLSNKTGYPIESVRIESTEYTDLIKVDDEHYLVSMPLPTGWGYYVLTEVIYQRAGLNKTASTEKACYTFMPDSNTVYSVSTADDLLHMNDGFHYYELTKDIDLSGIEWQGNTFCGVLNGNGHSIKNMSFVGTITNRSASLGLFTESTGVIHNLHFENAKYIVKQESTDNMDYNIEFGCITARALNALVIDHCSVDQNSFIHIDGNCIGGLVGEASKSVISNCTNNATVTGNDFVGGIAGNFGGGLFDTIINCVNNGTITGNNYVGGITSHISGGATITNCMNNGAISTIKGYGYVGGIVGSYNNNAGRFTIANCVNIGTITNDKYISGDYPDPNIVINCYALNDNATVEQLSSKAFYTDTLGWDEATWDLDDLDIANGKYPTIKPLS